jgi:Starch synthase catalytic domain.
VKKLRWAPDIIHCHGWISHVLPLYLKKAYKDDPVFSGAKVVLSLYDDTPAETFADGLRETILFGGIKPKDVPCPKRRVAWNLLNLPRSIPTA